MGEEKLCKKCHGFGEFGSDCPKSKSGNHFFNSQYPHEPVCLYCKQPSSETRFRCEECGGTGLAGGKETLS